MSRRGNRLPIVLLVVGVLVASGTAYLIVSEIRGARVERELEEGLSRVDRLLEERDFEGAEEALEGLSSSVRSAEGRLSLVKRAYRIGEETGDYDTAARLARRAARAHPANADLLVPAVHSSMRAGRTEEARSLLDGAPEDERFEALRAEAAIRAGRSPEDVERPEGEDRDGVRLLATLSRSSPPSDFARAFDMTADARFAVNEALRAARGGELENAFAALEERELVEGYPVLSALLAYDLERYDTYESMLEHMEPAVAVSAEQLMLQADIAMLRQDYGAAESIYTDVRRSEPSFAAQAYLNGAWIERSEPEQAQGILEEREGMFESHTGIARANVLLIYAHDPDAARGELEAALTRVENPGELASLEMHLFERTRGSVSSFVSRLWMTANTYPESPFPYRYLGWYLVSVNNWADLEVVVSRAEGIVEEELLDLYRGILTARDGEWDRARALFYEENGGWWQGAYNAGLSALAAGSSREASELFESALERLSDDAVAQTDTEQHSVHRARVLMFDALSHAARGDYSRAYRRVSEAVELDPKSARARYLMTSFADRLE